MLGSFPSNSKSTNMANRMSLCVKLIVFIYVTLCAQRRSFASEGLEYSNDNPSKLDDISVIELSSRFRRQASSESSNATDQTEETTTVRNDVTSQPPVEDETNNFGERFFPEEYNVLHDDHRYYTQHTFKAKNIRDYWMELDNPLNHDALSNSYRTAATANLPFNFTFYGHPIDKVTIATGGFLYMSPFIHKFLTATQYIAPLMANFDTKTGGDDSTILYKDFGFLYMSPFLHQWLTATQYVAPLMANFDLGVGNHSNIFYKGIIDNPQERRFIVEWRNVHLQDQKDSGSFQFQAILHENGSIYFVYKKLPVAIFNISSKLHPVKIGLSDAFYFDTDSQGVKRRTIYEYHRVTVNYTHVEEGTIVALVPVRTCNMARDCETCLGQKTIFTCKWCGINRRCSDGMDWHRQEWLNSDCLKYAGSSNCSLIPTAPPTPKKEAPSSTIAVVVVVVVIIVALLGALGGWFYYAYSHPNSASGMWLIEHRPSQMKAKLNTMKFWKKSGTTGDKYAVESTA